MIITICMMGYQIMQTTYIYAGQAYPTVHNVGTYTNTPTKSLPHPKILNRLVIVHSVLNNSIIYLTSKHQHTFY